VSPSTLILLALSACIAVSAAAGSPSRTEMASARGWARAHLQAGAEALPFSFTYGGKPSAQLLAAWPCKRSAEKLESGRTRTTTTWTDPAGGLQVRCDAVAYSDYPVVEWTLWFANKGGSDTPLLQDINAIDAAYEGGAGEPILHHNVGSPANKSDYSPLVTPLPQGASKRIGAAGGRPTNSDMSYFNLEWAGKGLIAAVGWPGQWSADFTHAEPGAVRLRAGQELTRFVLHPGEEVRSPLMALLWWQAGKGEDWVRGQNLWRRWMGAHSMPKPGGKLPPPQFVASSSRAYEEMIGANEANQIMHIDRYAELGLKLDYWWMDAGWYVQKQGWPQVGTWEVDRKRFPNGFKPISDRARDRGGRILVWFEPERVAPGTWLYETHPEWLLSAEPGKADAMAGLLAWRSDLGGPDPGVAFNSTDRDIRMGGIHWKPGRLSFHPGPKGEYCVVRWTCPAAGEYRLDATFLGIDEKTTTDVHILQAGKPLFSGFIGLNGAGREAKHGQAVRLGAGEALDFVVGWGNGTHQCDSTGLEARLTDPDGSVHEAARGFSYDRNPNGAWSYGWLPSGPAPDAAAFKPNTVRARGSDDAQKLLNLGNPEAWKWLVEHVDKLITDNGIGLYRQDFNIDPLGFWRANDEPDRQGITEIKHVMGYLAYWDELRRRHPDMLIDSCASGGRRNDLETMRRSVPLWRSDYAYEAIGHQCMTYGISMWLPYHGTGTVASDGAPYYGGGKTPVQPYAFWSNAAPSLGSGIDVREPDLDYDHLRRLVAAWRDLSQCYTGDYYPLTPTSQDSKAWIAWQFDLPERGEGAVQAFRRNECPDAEIRLKLKGIDPKAIYVIRNLDTGIETTVSGRELADKGLRLTSAAAPEAFAIRYGRK
jgi:alpha-galactosidase